MDILIIGQGAREHALAWKLAQSPLVKKLLIWPGNPAIPQQVAQTFPLRREASYPELVQAARAAKLGLVVCGPETPLAAGLQDQMAAAAIPFFGPSQQAAQLEASKAFAKNLMQAAGIPTAPFQLCSSAEESQAAAAAELKAHGRVVLKASGLASGKGVFVCGSSGELADALRQLYHSPLAEAAATVVVERFLLGRECSYFALLGPHRHFSLGFAVDFKRAEVGDKGPNTGGMGAYTPVPWLPAAAESDIEAKILKPLKRALLAQGITYQGFLYIGLMWTQKGPYVVEFNVRLGDPEAQVLAVHDQRDWLALMLQVLELAPYNAEAWQVQASKRKSVAIVMASRSYPWGVQRDDERNPSPFPPWIFQRQGQEIAIFGSSAITKAADHFYPGTGRVLTVVASQPNFQEAREQALEVVAAIGQHWPAGKWRYDIAAFAAEES